MKLGGLIRKTSIFSFSHAKKMHFFSKESKIFRTLFFGGPLGGRITKIAPDRTLRATFATRRATWAPSARPARNQRAKIPLWERTPKIAISRPGCFGENGLRADPRGSGPDPTCPETGRLERVFPVEEQLENFQFRSLSDENFSAKKISTKNAKN